MTQAASPTYIIKLVKYEVMMQVKAQRLPPLGVQVRISVAACTSSYIHWSALNSGCYAVACSTTNMQCSTSPIVWWFTNTWKVPQV